MSKLLLKTNDLQIFFCRRKKIICWTKIFKSKKKKERKKWRENLKQLFVRRLTLEVRLYVYCPSSDQIEALYTHLEDRSPRPFAFWFAEIVSILEALGEVWRSQLWKVLKYTWKLIIWITMQLLDLLSNYLSSYF